MMISIDHHLAAPFDLQDFTAHQGFESVNEVGEHLAVPDLTPCPQ
jgi:hypothetical protein